MNKSYRLVYSALHSIWVAVAENQNSRGKHSKGGLLVAGAAAMLSLVSGQALADAELKNAPGIRNEKFNCDPAKGSVHDCTYAYQAGTTSAGTDSNGQPIIGLHTTVTQGNLLQRFTTIVQGVHDGEISAKSTEAINGSQLFSLSTSLSALSQGGGAGDNSSLSTSTSTGLSTANSAIASLSTTTGELSTGLNTANSAIASLSTSTSNALSNLGSGGSKYVGVNSLEASAIASGTDAIAIGSKAVASGEKSIAQGYEATADAKNAVAIGSKARASAENSVALGAGSIANEANTVSVGSAGNERRITNVAAGINGNDAVNLKQLRSYTAEAKSAAHKGAASALAAASLPQVTQPGKSLLALAGSTYKGHSALAIGLSGQTSNTKWTYKANVTTVSGDFGAGAGVGYQF